MGSRLSNQAKGETLAMTYQVKAGARKAALLAGLILSVLGMGRKANAATYTVPGNFSTIQAAANAANPGDVIVVKPGTYNERVTVTRSGNASAPITFKSETRRTAVMQGFEINAAHITVNGFEITGTTLLGVYISKDNATVEDCYIHGMSDKGIAGYWKQPWPNNVTIRGNYIYDVQGGINICGSNWLVENNEVRRLVRRANSDNDYTRVFGNNNIIRNNKFWGTSKSEIGTSHVDGFQTYDNNGEYLTNTIFENNFVADCHQGMMAEAYNNEATYNLVFRNNVFTRCWSWGLNLRVIRQVHVYHNVFANMSVHGVGVRPGSDAIIKNNIFYNAGSNYFVESGGSMVAENNLIFKSGATESASKYPKDILNVDPKFVNMAGEDFRLASGSPAIDKGVNAGVTVDADGKARPQGGGFDIGAYESGSGGTPPPPVTPALSINDVSVNEGNSGSTFATFTVALSQAGTQNITVNYATANGTATTADSDYAAASGSLSFPAGTTTKTVAVMINGDTKVEGDETFSVNLSGAANATISDANGAGLIRNDDAAVVLPAVSVAEASVTEGNSGVAAMNFTVSLSAAAGSTVTVNYATIDGTATVADSDYSAANGTLSFAPGVTSRSVAVNVNGDTRSEGTEVLALRLSSPSGATLGTSEALGTIACDDGTTGDGGLVGHWTLDETAGTTINDSTVTNNDGQIGGGAAWAGSGISGGALNIGSGNGYGQISTKNMNATYGTVAMWVKPTAFAGTAQYIFGHTTNPTWGSRIQLYLNGTAGNLCLGMGNSHSSAINIQALPLNEWSHVAMVYNGSVYKVFVNGALKATGSYAGLTTIAPTMDIGNNGHPTDRTEPFKGLIDEVRMYNCISSDQEIAQLAVRPSDPSDQAEISIDDPRVAEGNYGVSTMTFTLTLNKAIDKVVSVDYATADYTAVAGSDYAAVSGKAVFPAGTTTQTVNVLVGGDTVYEANEQLLLNLSNPVNAALARVKGVGVIQTDDAAPQLSIQDVATVEGNSGTKSMVFTVTSSFASPMDLSFDYATSDNTATSNGDYVAKSGTITIPAGTTSATIAVTINGDTAAEADEDFFVNLSNAVNAGFNDAKGVGTIQSDDIDSSLPVITVNPVSVNESNSGNKWAIFVLKLDKTSTKATTVRYVTVNGTAVAPGDYIAEGGLVKFPAGSTSAKINVAVVGDTVKEGKETFGIQLSNPVGLTIATATAECTINDND